MVEEGEDADVRGESGCESEWYCQAICQADDDVPEYRAIVGVVFWIDVFGGTGSFRGK